MTNDEIGKQIYRLYVAIYDSLSNQNLSEDIDRKKLILTIIKNIDIFDTEEVMAKQTTSFLKNTGTLLDEKFETDLSHYLFGQSTGKFVSLLVLTEIKCEIAEISASASTGRKLKNSIYISDSIKARIINNQKRIDLFFRDLTSDANASLPFATQPEGLWQRIWGCCIKAE